MRKTILPVLMTATISLSLLACGSNNSGESESTTNITEAETMAIVAESENASTATEPDAGQNETTIENESTETTEVITKDSTETPATAEVSKEAENNIISPLSYEDFNINGFGYSNYVDLYGAGNGYEDVERISIMTTNCTAYNSEMIAYQEHRSASLCFMVLFRKASLVHDTQFSIYLRPVSNRCSPFLGSFKGGQIQCL